VVTFIVFENLAQNLRLGKIENSKIYFFVKLQPNNFSTQIFFVNIRVENAIIFRPNITNEFDNLRNISFTGETNFWNGSEQEAVATW